VTGHVVIRQCSWATTDRPASLPKVVRDDIVLAGGFVSSLATSKQAQQRGPLLVFAVEAGEPSREALHGSLKLRMEVDEGAQLISEPRESDLIIPPACLELLDTPISEIHVYSWARLAHGAGMLIAQCDRGEWGSPEALALALIVPPITSARLRRSPSGYFLPPKRRRPPSGHAAAAGERSSSRLTAPTMPVGPP
jgi:hypothetical protein